MDKHTPIPLPYRIREGETKNHAVDILGNDINGWICQVGDRSTAKFIVKCCNSHAKLVEVCKKFVSSATASGEKTETYKKAIEVLKEIGEL